MAFTQWRAGSRIKASQLAAISPTWTAWTPTWTTSTGLATPSFGNATVDCKYAQSADIVFFEMQIVFGSTTNFGGGAITDNWRFSTPVTASGTSLNVGSVELIDASVASAFGRVAGTIRLATTTTFDIDISSGPPDGTALTNGGIIDTLSPWTWANGDGIRVSGQYQAA